MTNQIRLVFGGVDTDLDTFIEQSQFVQAEAMKTFCELFRTRKFTRLNGLIWWNVRDGWPQLSDAVVDYYYAKKLAYYVIKRSQQPICLMFREPKDGKLELVGANEFLEDVTVSYCVKDLKTGTVAAQGTAFLPKNSVSTVAWTNHMTDGMHFYVMEWTCGQHSGKNYYVCAEAPYSFDEYYGYMKSSDMWEADFLV
jgi:beta-mannosidase